MGTAVKNILIKPGRKKHHKGSGINIPSPDKVVEYTIDKEGYEEIDVREKTTIGLVDKPIVVTKHRIHVYKTSNGDIVEAEADLPEGWYGKNLQALVCLLKEKFGTSHEKIANLIKSIRPDISFCTATSVSLIDKMATALAPERKKIIEKIRNHSYCNADETGLRKDGANGYVWAFTTPNYVIYETDPTRSSAVPRRILGEDYDNIVVCDG